MRARAAMSGSQVRVARKQKGRFCGDFSRVVVSDFRSLRGDIGFRSLFEAPVSGGKNPVPNSIGQAGRKSALTPALPAFDRG